MAGLYDFNSPRYNIDAVIDALRNELRSIVINSQSSIDDIKKRLAGDEAMLMALKRAVDGLPDYTAQYEVLMEELSALKAMLDEIADHPIELGFVQVEVD